MQLVSMEGKELYVRERCSLTMLEERGCPVDEVDGPNRNSDAFGFRIHILPQLRQLPSSGKRVQYGNVCSQNCKQ